jgi:uncharacterized membrane protein
MCAAANAGASAAINDTTVSEIHNLDAAVLPMSEASPCFYSPATAQSTQYARRGLGKARVEAFSDGVIAIAITLLVLDIHVPEPGGGASLAHRLAEQWPSYAAYVVSFLTIGIIWVNHTAMLRRLGSVDHSILFLNIFLLMTIAVLPFTTALMAAYLKAEDGENLAAVIYGGSLLLMGLAFFAMQQHLLRTRVQLLREDLTPAMRRLVLKRNAAGLVPYAVATLCGIFSPYLTLALCGLVAGFYALPASTSDTAAD